MRGIVRQLLVLAVVAPPVLAQLPATALWETSIDGGSTWFAGDVIVQDSTTSIGVRVRVGWDPTLLPDPTTSWYADCRFEAIVESVMGAGASDTAASFQWLDRGNWEATAPGIISAQRFGSLLKIDAAIDALPPGQGVGIGPNQHPWDIMNPSTQDNPVRIFQYELVLDGSLGRRDLYGMWLPSPTGEPVQFRIWQAPFDRVYVTSLTQFPASVTVVPAPSVLLVCAGAVLAMSTRRRGRMAR